MKSSLIFLVSGCLGFMSLIAITHAESLDSGVSTGATSMVVSENPLLVDNIKAVDTKHVDIIFNQSIIRESVRVRITKQSDDTNIRIESLTGSSNESTVRAILTDTLEADTAYKMTIVSAISEEGVIIKDGADGLKEFSTPLDLQEYTEEVPVIIELNAPPNPNAIVIATTGSESVNNDSTIMVATNTGETEILSPSETTDELPPAGSNPLIYLAIAGTIAFILLIRRRQA